MIDDVEETRRLTMSRHYDAPRELVWAAWTEPAQIAAWWGPFGPDQTISEIDAAIGGVFSVVMSAPDGSRHPSRGVILEFDPPNKLVIEGDADAPDACGAGLPPRAIITVTFDDEDGGTKLTLDAIFPSVDACEAAKDSGYATSWSETLDGLAQHFEERMSAR